MSTVVVGASGFIGRAVVEALRRDGVSDVLVAGRRAECAWALDLTAPDLRLPDGVETVLNLAGEKHDTPRMVAVNVEGPERLVHAAARAGARMYLHLSSVGVYGAPKHAGVVTERFPHTPHGPYETSKDDGERRVRSACAERGLRCAVLQPSNVLGVAHGRPLLGLVRAVSSGRYVHVGARPAWVNYVAVDDVAEAVIAACSARADGTWIVNTACELPRLLGWIADELRCRTPTARIPLWVGAAAAKLAGAVRPILRRELPLSPERYREMTNTTRFDGTGIERDLGFRYATGVEATVRCLAARYRREGLA